jgi:pimeloyl-ACP methyl ester carboxylesterase
MTTWVVAGGVTLHAVSWGAGVPETVLIHELGGTHLSWRGLQPHIPGRSWALDLRGAGLSEKPLGATTIETYADDVAAFTVAMGLRSIRLVGVAMGAIVAALAAARHPDLVARLVICNGTDTITTDAGRYIRERAMRVRSAGMAAVADASLKNSFPTGHDAARAAYRPIFLGNDPVAYAAASEALAALVIGPNVLGRIRAPTLVVTGVEDFIWPTAHGERLASRIPGARFVALAGAGHFPHLQRPEMLAALLSPFIAAA